MAKLTVTLAQFYPRLGDLQGNLERHLEIMQRSADQGANLVVFPELSLTGYYLKDLFYELAIKAQPTDPIFGPLLAQTAQLQLDAVVGFVEEDQRGRFYVAAAYLSRGEILHVHRKIYLPTYGLFDEGRFFAAGDQVRAFDTPYGRFGLLICEDFWHVSLPYLLWMDGADLLIFINASPARGLSTDDRLSSMRWVDHVNEAYGGLFGAYILQCNRTGFEDGLNFGGGSSIVGTDGEMLAQARYFEEDLLLHTLDLNQIRRTRSRLPLLRDERPDLLLRELGRILGQAEAG